MRFNSTLRFLTETRTATFALLMTVALPFVLSGCREAAKADRKSNVELNQLGSIYYNFCNLNNQGPAGPDDLTKMEKRFTVPAGVTVIWGVDVTQTPNSDQVVLAYEADVPQKGGYVLFANNRVDKVTSEEFAKLKIAKPKKK